MSGAIDVWCNLFTEEGLRTLLPEGSAAAEMLIERWGLGDAVAAGGPEAFVADLDTHHVDRVLVPSLKQWLDRERRLVSISLDSVVALAARFPGRVSGLYGVDPVAGMEGVREFERAVREHGFVGAHIHAYGFGLPVNHARWYPFYAKAVELGVPVMLQLGHSGEFMPSAHGRPLLIDDVALDFPELSIVGAHHGWPWVEELVAMAWKHPNVYVAATAHAPRYWDEKMVRFLNSRGIGKVMWGTDFPVLRHGASLEQVGSLGLKPEALEALLSTTARRVFGLA